jgi:putative transposase
MGTFTPGSGQQMEVSTVRKLTASHSSDWHLVAAQEPGELAQILIAESCTKQAIVPAQLTLHSDRGSPLKSKPVTDLLRDLGIIKSQSCPHVSDDNPFSEAQFKTLKYRPDYPDRFADLEYARG